MKLKNTKIQKIVPNAKEKFFRSMSKCKKNLKWNLRKKDWVYGSIKTYTQKNIHIKSLKW
jgi:hypothetical protein